MIKVLLSVIVLTANVLLVSAQTTLPTIRIDYEGELSKETEVNATFVLEVTDEKTGEIKKESYLCTVHHRGATSITYDKKSLAVDIVDENGEDIDANLLGLREGNNKWILDALASDHSGLRNRVAMDMFTAYSELPYDTDYHGRYSTVGKFVELWLNGKYWGLYCLSDKVNRKLTGTKKEKNGKLRGVLYKCIAHGQGGFFLSYDSKPIGSEEEWNGWKLQYPNSASSEAWQPLVSVFDIPWGTIADDQYVATVNNFFFWDNMVDVYLLTMVLSLGDFGFKNCYLASRDTREDRRMIIVPWDLDYTFGSTWNGVYWLQATTLRGKSTFQFAHPFRRLISTPGFGFIAAVAKRWAELKDNVLAVETVRQRITDYARQLDESGAWQRNREVWNYNPITLDNTAKEAAGYMADWYADNYERVDELLQPYIEASIDDAKVTLLDNDKYYDLQGRAVHPSATTKGILIHNHKAIIQ